MVRLQKVKWDGEYAQGKWNYLKGVSELAHYSIIVGYCQFYASHSSPTILDLGCGEGVLFDYLPMNLKSNYHGVDISRIAIRKAKRRNPAIRFVCDAIEKFTPKVDDKFEIIIFNEVIYYFDSPAKEIDRYRSFLAPDGKIIVSIYVGKNFNKVIFRKIKTLWKSIEKDGWGTVSETHILDVSSKNTWQVRVLQRVG